MGKRVIPLRNTTDLRRYLASAIARLENGELDPGIAGKIGYLSNTLAKVLELESFEKRLALLEQAMETRDLVNVTPEKRILQRG